MKAQCITYLGDLVSDQERDNVSAELHDRNTFMTLEIIVNKFRMTMVLSPSALKHISKFIDDMTETDGPCKRSFDLMRRYQYLSTLRLVKDQYDDYYCHCTFSQFDDTIRFQITDIAHFKLVIDNVIDECKIRRDALRSIRVKHISDK